MILKNLLYIYQLEQYDKKRFLLFAYKNLNWFTLNKRANLHWTHRAGMIFAVCLTIIAIPAMITFLIYGTYGMILFYVFALGLLPVYIVIADTAIAPLIVMQKNNIMVMAKRIINEGKKKKLKTIGITGSFGKTTMKNMLKNVLEEKHTVLSIPGNINTEIGVANHIIKHKEVIKEADMLLVEMGAYRKGDIKKLCSFIEPDYSFITAIGECHLERFGSLDNIIAAKFELANATKKKVFLNASDENVKKNATSAIGKNSTCEVVEVSGKREMGNIQHLKDCAGITFTYREKTFTTKIIADYIIDFAAMAFVCADLFGLTTVEMQRGFEKMSVVPHRLEVIRNKEEDRIIIDDSYNGNYAGFMEGLEILQREKRRKVVLTPGLVELGAKRSEEVHTELAKKYMQTVDLVLLVKNKNTEYILREMRKSGHTDFKVYDTAKEAHADLPNVLKDGDIILFQSDATDNYT